MNDSKNISSYDLHNGLQTKKVETHCHTLGGSPCAKVPGRDAVKAHAEAGYGALIITNHYEKGCLENLSPFPKQAAQLYVDLYREAFEYGQEIGIDVWFGLEPDLDTDYLVFGAEPDFVYENPLLYNLTPEELFRECEQYGCLLYQAHPFREGVTVGSPEYMHGIEVYNGKPWEHYPTEKALRWAEDYGLLKSSGTDYHVIGEEGYGGILVPEYIRDIKALAAYMRKNEVTLMTC